MLATYWEVSPDGKAWTFRLRKGVPFHFGLGKFTAGDVVHSMNMLTQGGSLADSAPHWRDILDRIDVVDPYTVVFVLKRPEPDLIRYVSTAGDLVMLSQAQWNTEGQVGIEPQPAGTGPYQFSERTLDLVIVFKRVEGHWRINPDFKDVRIRFVREEHVRYALLLTGETHLATSLDRTEQAIIDDGLRAIYGQASPGFVGVRPEVVSDYIFPGNIPGTLTHLEYVETTRY